MELRFVLPHDPESTAQDVVQRIYQSDGTYRERAAGEWEYHPIHDHYHFTSFGLSQLWASTASGERVGSEPVRPGRKVSFCVADIEIDAWLQKGDGPRTFNAPDCLFPDPSQSDANNDYLVQGITAGWADVYDWFLPDQYLEISGLADGHYILETIVDPDNAIVEANERNNCGAVLIRLEHLNSERPQVELLAEASCGTGDRRGPEAPLGGGTRGSANAGLFSAAPGGAVGFFILDGADSHLADEDFVPPPSQTSSASSRDARPSSTETQTDPAQRHSADDAVSGWRRIRAARPDHGYGYDLLDGLPGIVIDDALLAGLFRRDDP